MLNKLLKRCMPWQQRGKWVRIYVNWTDTTNPPVVKGPDWLNVTVVNMGHGDYVLSYDPDDYYSVTEVKKTLTSKVIFGNDDNEKLIYLNPDDRISDMYGGKGYVDMFLCNIKVTTVSNGSVF